MLKPLILSAVPVPVAQNSLLLFPVLKTKAYAAILEKDSKDD